MAAGWPVTLAPRQIYTAAGLPDIIIAETHGGGTVALVGETLWSLLTRPLLKTLGKLGYQPAGYEDPAVLAEMVSLAMATARCAETRRAA